MKNVSFNLTDEEFEIFENKRFEARLTKSQYIRNLLFPNKQQTKIKTASDNKKGVIKK